MKIINIENELPEIGKDVLLLTDSGWIEGSRKDEDWEFITLDIHGCGCCCGDSDIVTHWMELPPIPKNNRSCNI